MHRHTHIRDNIPMHVSSSIVLSISLAVGGCGADSTCGMTLNFIVKCIIACNHVKNPISETLQLITFIQL